MKVRRNQIFVLSAAILLSVALFDVDIILALRDLAAQTGREMTAMAKVLTALSLGALVSQLLGGSLIDRIGPRPMILGSMGVLGVALLALTQARSVPLLLLFAAVGGLGHGVLSVALIVLVSGLFAEKRGPAMNLLYSIIRAGSFVLPGLAAYSLNRLDTVLPSLMLSGGLILLLLLPAALCLPRGQAHLAVDERETVSANPYTSLFLWAFCAVNLLYSGMFVYVPSNFINIARGSIEMARVDTGFNLAVLAGGIAAIWLGMRLSGRTLLLISLLTVLGGSLLLVLGYGTFAWSVAGILLLGFGFGPVFPTSISLVTAAFPRAGGKATGLVVAFGSLGGMVVPWLQGLLIESPGLGSTPWLAIAAGLGMLGSLALAYRVPKSRG